MTVRPRGYANWRPQTKTSALLHQIDDVLGEYADFLPLTVRQIFYRLVATHGYAKEQLAYDRLIEHLNRARRAELIPFWKIRDDGVVIMRSAWYEDTAQFHDETGRRIRGYRRNRQNGQPQRMELWCEAAGMLGQLARVANEYSVPVYSASGFASVTGTHDIAERACDREVPTVILHVGLHDPSGVSIFTAMVEDAAAFVEAERITANLALRGVRVALTPEQIAKHDLPTAPPKDSDKRGGSWTETCQAEALSPDVLATYVREAIRGEIDLDRYRRELALEEEDRASLLALPSGDE